MGTQTVRGTCKPPTNSNFFLLTTHTHKYATAADVNYVSSGQTTNLVHTTDWESPGTHVWQSPNFLTTKDGDTFTYSCAYQNPNSFAVTVGETPARNEMCMAIGYFFPQGTASCYWPVAERTPKERRGPRWVAPFCVSPHAGASASSGAARRGTRRRNRLSGVARN
jgi:hypothetical protein